MHIRQVLEFWGKARPAVGGEGASWHPVAYHLLDVAACADALLRSRAVTSARASWLLGMPESEAHALLVAMIALHDLGKFAPRFQQIATPEGWEWPTSLVGVDVTRLEPSRHTADGLLLWRDPAFDAVRHRIWPHGSRVMEALECAVFAHHGRPVESPMDHTQTRFPVGAVAAALHCAQVVLDRVLPAPLNIAPPSLRRIQIASWWVAGFVTIADWIGSRTTWFPYRQPIADDDGLVAYWAEAQAKAAVAVRSAGMDALLPASARTFFELTGKQSPTPVQEWALQVPLPDGPLLAVVEDATGAGKTEAAHVLVNRLLASGRASGAYWAMPTQATANAMYERQRVAIASLFRADGDRLPSLTLGHGQAALHADYRATVLTDRSTDLQAYAPGESHEQREGDQPATVACSAFLADDRRAALLADLGAGTVDQALLGVLPTRFNAVRLFALAEKVLVLDEVHAFDAYMTAETRDLLRFHSALGGSAILLSATLPEETRRTLEDAWRAPDLDGPTVNAVPSKNSPYPMATMLSSKEGGIRHDSPSAAPWTIRRVPTRPVHTLDAAYTHVLHVAERGGAVVWIRNTVDECVAAADTLRARGAEPIVFHARYAQGDRQRTELEVMQRFGPSSTPALRSGSVLVATQVVEQSLDLDFDGMVSDLAPIDLLVQRAGRLWRHAHRDASERPSGIERELLVLCPADKAPAPEWPAPLLPKVRYVYPDAGVLWRTAELLQRGEAIDAPGNIRQLMREVYESSSVPEALQRAVNIAEGNDRAAEGIATYVTVKLGGGYAPGRHWTDDLRAKTRLGDEQIPVRLARVVDARLAPWHDDHTLPDWKRWLLSEVKLSAGRVAARAAPVGKWAQQIEAVRADWKPFERETPVLALEMDSAGVWRGELPAPGSAGVVAVRYCRELGVRFGAQ
jgi:CRISPR-associated endonuclease/helicase Cas3